MNKDLIEKEKKARGNRSVLVNGYKVGKLELRQAEENGPAVLAGLVVPYSVLSDEDAIPWFRERFLKGAFARTIVSDDIKAYWMHEKTYIFGSTKAGTLRLSEKDAGLFFEIDMPNTSMGNDAIVSIKRGDVDGMSFCFRAVVQEWDEKDPENVIRTITEADLFEISPEPFPAYTSTSVSARSAESDFNEYKKHKDGEEREKNLCDNESRKRSLFILENQE